MLDYAPYIGIEAVQINPADQSKNLPFCMDIVPQSVPLGIGVGGVLKPHSTRRHERADIYFLDLLFHHSI